MSPHGLRILCFIVGLREASCALPLCSSGCGSCSYGPHQYTSLSGQYYYKTTNYYECTSSVCSDGSNKHYTYQAYSDSLAQSSEWNVYLAYDCNTLRYQRYVVDSCGSSDKFTCDQVRLYGGAPTTNIGSEGDACPYSNGATCSTATHGHNPHIHRPHSHTPHGHTPHVHTPSPSPPPPSPSPPTSASSSWTVISGPEHCELSNDGACVTDGAGNYGNSEACEVRADVPMTLSVTAFNTESGYDKLTVGGTQYSGTAGPSGVVLAAGDTISWSSDSSNMRSGFEVCTSTTIEATFTASGDVSDYSSSAQDSIKATFASPLTNLGVTADDVELSIVSGSVTISATITIAAASASAAVNTLASGIMASDTALTSAIATNGLSVTVETITPLQVAASPSPPPPSPSPPPPSASASTVGICDAVNNLPCFGSGGPCACTSTNNGAGLFGECTQSLPLGLGSIGVKVEIEPCDCGGPYAAVSYQIGTTWTEAGRIKANGDPLQFPVPLVSAPGIGGLYIHVTLAGTRGKLTVTAELSLCAGDDCNGDISLVGYLATAAGFPISLFDIQESTALGEFCDRAPACEEDSALLSPMMMAAAGGAAVVVLGAIILYRAYSVKKSAPTKASTIAV